MHQKNDWWHKKAELDGTKISEGKGEVKEY